MKSSEQFPLVDEFEIGTPQKGEQGQNFKMLHIQIRNFKNWLRGVHSYCDKETLNQYIDEYFFRFNRLNFREIILDKLLVRMTRGNPIGYKSMRCDVV